MDSEGLVCCFWSRLYNIWSIGRICFQTFLHSLGKLPRKHWSKSFMSVCIPPYHILSRASSGFALILSGLIVTFLVLSPESEWDVLSWVKTHEWSTLQMFQRSSRGSCVVQEQHGWMGILHFLDHVTNTYVLNPNNPSIRQMSLSG